MQPLRHRTKPGVGRALRTPSGPNPTKKNRLKKQPDLIHNFTQSSQLQQHLQQQRQIHTILQSLPIISTTTTATTTTPTLSTNQSHSIHTNNHSSPTSPITTQPIRKITTSTPLQQLSHLRQNKSRSIRNKSRRKLSTWSKSASINNNGNNNNIGESLSTQSSSTTPTSSSKSSNSIKDWLNDFSTFGIRMEFEQGNTQDPHLVEKINKWREFGQQLHEMEEQDRIEKQVLLSRFREINKRVFGPIFAKYTDEDRHGHYPDHIGTRHEYSDLQPLLFSSNEYPSFLKQDGEKLLTKLGLMPLVKMGAELIDDAIEHLNRTEPFGQRKKERKYRLLNKLNKPYARYSFDEMEEQLRDDQSRFHDLERDYWIQRDINERKSIDLKRKARRAMGLEPDVNLEDRWARLSAESPAKFHAPRGVIQAFTGNENISEFEKFREEFKAREDSTAGDQTAVPEGAESEDVESSSEDVDPLGHGTTIDTSRRYESVLHEDKPTKIRLNKDGTIKEKKNKDQVQITDGDKKRDPLEDFDDNELAGGSGDGKSNASSSSSSDKKTTTKKKVKRKITNDDIDIDDENLFNDDADESDADIEFEHINDQELWSAGGRALGRQTQGGDYSDNELRERRMPGEDQPMKPEPDGIMEKNLQLLVDVLERRQTLFVDKKGDDPTGWWRMKPRRYIHDEDGLTYPRADLFGYPKEYLTALPADEEDMNSLERKHWMRRIRAANHRKYFRHGWKYETQWGVGPRFVAHEYGRRDYMNHPTANQRHPKGSLFQKRVRSKNRPRFRISHFGFGGLYALDPTRLGEKQIYDYLYGREIPQLQSHGGVLSVDLFRVFPYPFRKNEPPIEWTGTTAITYDPQQNHITKWELRRQALKYKLSMSPVGDLTRWAWKMFNIDMFPFTHVRYPFGWIMANFRYFIGLRHALARWTKTAAHTFIDQRFAYQSNRYGERQSRDVYHYINEYDYLKEYQLPIVVRAIREYDFDVLRSACSEHALFNILKWLHIQDRFGIYFEYRRNYWVESLDIKDVRKDENNSLVLNVEFVLIEPPYFYNRAGGKIFPHKSQYKWLYRPQPLVMSMTLLRDYLHPDFDYQVVDFKCDARRVKRVFNNIERIYHSAQRSRTQYHQAPKFYAVRRTIMDRTYYSRRTIVLNAYNKSIENTTFDEKELDFQDDMENRYNEMIKYREGLLLQPYLIALQLEPIIDMMVAHTKEHPAFQLHPIQRDTKAYWEQRKELDLVKFRQREARRIRSQQNTLHRYFHKLRSIAYFKHTYDHGGDLDEYRRLHIDKLAIDSNHDDWVQKWFVDPERAGRPYFKNLKGFTKILRKQGGGKKVLKGGGRHSHINKKRRNKTWKPGYKQVLRHWRRFRLKKALRKMKLRKFPQGRGPRMKRRFWKARRKKIGHNMRRNTFRKRRRFLPYMERMYVRMPRGGFWEAKKFFRVRNHRVNAYKGNTTLFSPKHKGPGYSQYDTRWHEKWHVWDGGYYNPNEYCWTRADVFHPTNQPFDPRRNYSMSFLEENTLLMPQLPYRDWNLPWRVGYSDHGDPHMRHLRKRPPRMIPSWTHHPTKIPELRKKFHHLPNAEVFTLNDDANYEEHENLRKWPVPDDDKWKI